ncbi:MAG TPA: type II toxin-antitoxin system Phd/YefM family antitoxin [Polyangiaceae bacterium]|jgi:prevent-host-death family protein|nr:type II toxin-antitoxin system Phd/YefM family antitoxin [Polyangiaceae bacterium]
MEINIYAAKTQLSQLVRRVADGEEVVITRNGQPVARLVPVAQRAVTRKLGTLAGTIRIGEDFDAPLPAELLDAFEGKA